MNEPLIGAIIVLAFVGAVYYLVKRSNTRGGKPTGGNGGGNGGDNGGREDGGTPPQQEK